MNVDLGVFGEVSLNLIDTHEWIRHGLHVTHDGFTEQGVRVHVVTEEVGVTVLDNAIVLSLSVVNSIYYGIF